MKTISINKLPATTGKKTIVRADDVFTGWIDSDFENWGTDKVSSKTKELNVTTLELTENMTFKQMFTTPESMCLTQEQIILYCSEHKDMLTDWYTFFLFKVGAEFFVADVDVHSRGLSVYVYRFGRADVWDADCRHRFVIPQLTTELSDPVTLRNFNTLSLELEKAIEICKQAGLSVSKLY